MAKSFFSGVNINSGVEEDRSNRWIIGALGLIDGKRSEAVVFQLKSGSPNGSGVRPSGIGLVSGGKEGRLYLVNRDSMGHFCVSCTTTDTNVVQSFMISTGFFCTPAFWQNALYFAGSFEGAHNGDKLKRLLFDPSSGQFNPSPVSQSAIIFNFPGATPSISSQGSLNGIVWAIDSSHTGNSVPFQSGPAVLFAYDATDLAKELWDSSQAGGNRDKAGAAVKFMVPTVANGKVYIGTRTELDVYGLL